VLQKPYSSAMSNNELDVRFECLTTSRLRSLSVSGIWSNDAERSPYLMISPSICMQVAGKLVYLQHAVMFFGLLFNPVSFIS